MKAIVITAYGPPEVLAVSELPDPVPAAGEVLIRVAAFGTEEFPLAGIPLQEMITKAETGRYQAKPARVFGFEEIITAHQIMEEGLAAGKMTVAVN